MNRRTQDMLMLAAEPRWWAEPLAPWGATVDGARTAWPEPRSIAAEPRALDATEVRLYDDRDAGWIGTIVDEAIAVTGQPWRVLRERLEHSPIGGPRVAAILGAMRRVMSARVERARIARSVRAQVLGSPALDDAARDARLAAAAEHLGLTTDAILELMWIDLANERPVVFPRGRPAERELAAYANLDRLQRAVRSARTVRLRVDGDAHDLIRMTSRSGLIATVTRAGDSTVIEVLGPLALFHDTRVYGRALASLMPLLADHPRFQLDLECDFGHGPASLRVLPPALLPPVSTARLTPGPVDKLARQLVKTGIEIERDPPAVVHAGALEHPDLIVRHAGRAWTVELVGFATAEHLAAKLARYHAAGVTDLALVVHHDRAPRGPADAHVLAYKGRLTAETLLRFLEERS